MTVGRQSAPDRSVADDRKLILAVVVLYKMPADSSPAFAALRAQLDTNTEARALIDLIVCDNTPYEQPRPTGYLGPYVRFPDNPGLARCYNTALASAIERAIPWLLVLDQDTTLNAEYLREVLRVAQKCLYEPEIAILAPKLVNKSVICSPHYPPFLSVASPVDVQMTGVSPTKLFIFNSGAVLRVASLVAMGGFPEEFPLDFLDHATYTPLQLQGGKVFVLSSQLHHDLSTNDHGRRDPALVSRQTGMLDSEYRFYRQYGTAGERWLLRLRLLRGAAGRAVKFKNWDQTWRIIKSALRP